MDSIHKGTHTCIVVEPISKLHVHLISVDILL